jgi:hypothetical protein
MDVAMGISVCFGGRFVAFTGKFPVTKSYECDSRKHDCGANLRTTVSAADGKFPVSVSFVRILPEIVVRRQEAAGGVGPAVRYAQLSGRFYGSSGVLSYVEAWPSCLGSCVGAL